MDTREVIDRYYETVYESYFRIFERCGLEVIGVYHSHPDHPPAPSAFDREHAWPWLSYVIVGVGAGRAGDPKSWVLADDRGTFAEESITIEERKAVWQSPY